MDKDNKESGNVEHKEFTIIVNAREKKWGVKEISYQQVVELAFGSYSDNENIVYTVTYSKGDDHKKEGSLIKGQTVNVKDGMIFNATRTDKS
ncbi:MAG: multiubiquitin domain-containing protein [Minisyncoccia bacterium]